MKKQLLTLMLIALTTLCTASTVKSYTFNPNYDHSISLSDASTLTRNFRILYPTQPKSYSFGSAAVISIMNQQDCKGLIIIEAVDATGAKTKVLAGLDINNNVMYNGILAERSMSCPPPGNCPASNPLMND